ncbi:hypothetical protein PYCCODRAFT_1383895 [Trametes coccinea BRFM310]|uniref:Uncharacterized protein n=1 Tax=Trametes coccinea (strain BRFM310) TaxID=1353009 RepID=A0A1Y2IXU9_TRAC3|nr:hypothetical protein PYCCODRAFT_1383895 [Trametes coccinea BRFM310]
MDELVRHCLRELSFDGDLGCDVSRLRDFITDFYAHPPAGSRDAIQGRGQNVDDAFCAFVWSLIVQQPSVRVGTVPPGASAEVYIAPQASAIRKGKAKASGGDAEGEAATASALELIPDATIRSLEDLKNEYGDRLRIAVDPETTFHALTGSHIRPSKLTPMIYTGLQIITRGREEGVSVLDLGKKSGYDQKTCFYIIKQLVELDLVLKLRRPGISTNFCVHKYFYERSPIWKQVAEEEKKAVSEAQARVEGTSGADSEIEEDETKPLEPVHFDPIDSRHLSSMPLLKARLTKLLKSCPYNMHTSNNIMLKIGFVNPTRTDRRFFLSRLRELMEQGFIEKVQVPHADRQRYPDRRVQCIRLVTEEAGSQPQGDIGAVADVDFEEVEDHVADDDTGLKANVSLQRQIIDLIADSGTKGMTLNEISATLGDFDRRTIDLLLNRLAQDAPPAHLADLGIAQLGETQGRERRYKYYTVANYLTLADREGFEDQRYRDVDMSHVGEFLAVEGDVFFEREEEMVGHVAGLSSTKRDILSTAKGKKKKLVNPILPDGSVKRGRPRKHPLAEGTPTFTKTGKKRKREEPVEGDAAEEQVTGEGMGEPPLKKKRGRPPKKVEAPATDSAPAPADTAEGESVMKRKRGRPPKNAAVADVGEGTSASVVVGGGSSTQTPAPKRRGRPPKNTQPPGTEEDVFGPVPSSAESATAPTTGSAENSGFPQMDVTPSSPPSAIPDSPLRASSPRPAPIVPEAADPQSVEQQEGVTLARGDEPTASTTAQDSPTALRRSARTPKVKKRGDSLSPVRSQKRAQRGKPPTAPNTIEESAGASFAAGPASATTQVSSVDLTSAAADDARSAESAVHYTAPSTAGSQSVTQGPVAGPSSDVSQAIPIDPILLQPGASAALSMNEHSLIAMTPEPEFPEAGSSISQGILRKRDQPETPSSQPSAKRTKSTQSDGSRFRSKANISQSRRENEIMRLLEDAGGILNTSCKEFYEAHAALVDSITKAGEIASTRPGAKIDKRTLETTLVGLEGKGKVKIVTTMVPNPTGSTRPVRVVYLPETPSEQLNAFLAQLSETVQPVHVPSLKTLDEPLAYGGIRDKSQAKPRPSMTLKITEDQTQLEAHAAQLFQKDEQTIRDALLTEKNTVAQLYGYIVGKAARAKALHMLTVNLFESGSTSSQLVSQNNRIINLAHYYTDLPVSAYCSLVAVSQPNDELGNLLHSREGRATPMKDLPDSVRSALTPTQSRSRARILSLLDMLRVLGLVTPLSPTEGPNPAITCTPLAEHPAAFDIAVSGPYTPSTAPTYWKFNDIAPIRLWAIPQGLPPVWKMASVMTEEQAAAYWNDLERASTDLEFAESTLGAVQPAVENAPSDVVSVAKTLRRSGSWNATYNLSWYQTEYLRRFIDPATGHTPLEDEDEAEEQLNKLSWITSASKEAIISYFSKARKRHLRDLKKVEARVAKGKQKAGDDAGAVLARRAAEAKEQRERDWEEMLHRVHPGELPPPAIQRIQRLKTKFMHGAGKPSDKWQGRIVEAIREAEMVAEKLLPAAAQTSVLPPMPVAKPVLPAPVVTATQEKDVDELIAAQGPRAQQEARAKKSKKGKDKDTGGSSQTPRRHRFLWNRDYDELVRDASVIIKARCRGGTRLDWGALEQVFPAVPRNSVRQRLVHLRETPGTETYLARLEDKWYELWTQHRGTEVLPDPDPESATNFDLATHVKFLRKHIDKNAIRVGFVEVQADQKAVLPSSIEELEQAYDVVEKVPTAPPWDFMWSVVAEEGREKQFAQHAFIAEVGDMPPVTSYESDFIQVADAAVKMALGNPNETYDPDTASQLLKGVGEEPVRIATTELLNRGVLAKIVRDPSKSKPGRTLKISDNNLNALGGQLPREVFQDAMALEESLSQQEDPYQWQEWSLLASDGDTAYLIELASKNKVQFDVDTSHPRSMRSIIDWNSKKADDDDIETDIRVRYLDLARPVLEPPAPELPTAASDTPEELSIDPSLRMEHGKKTDGEPAFCRRTSEGLIDCPACLQEAESSYLQELSQDERIAAEKVLALLRDAGSSGLSKQQLQADLEAFSPTAIRSVIRCATDATIPLAYWTGYAAVVLVSAIHIKPWTVTVTEPDDAGVQSMVFPRRWLDIYGRKLNEVWDAATRAVVSLILLRAGISQAEIRWRLRSVYDRQEVLEVLQALQEDGYILPRIETDLPVSDIGPADEEEEKVTFWFLTCEGRRWYQV